MLGTPLKVALRSLRRRPGYTAINVAGLALGLACCVLLVLYVRSELAVDTLFADAARIHRVGSQWRDEAMGPAFTAPAPAGRVLVEAYPEVEAQVRLWAATVNVRADSGAAGPALRRSFYVADANALAFFGLPLRAGDVATALRGERTVVLHERLAEALFGTADAVGRTLLLETFRRGEQPYTVTGVWGGLPFNSLTDFGGGPYELITSSVATEDFLPADAWDDWRSRALLVYVKLAPAASAEALAAKLGGFTRAHAPPELHGVYRPTLEPLRTLYLDGDGGRNRRAVGLLAGLAALILLVACINFANLATARALERAREIGVRKAIGARRAQLVGPLLGEAVLVAAVATALGAGLARAVQGPFFALAGKPMVLAQPWDLPMALALVGIALLTGLLAGLYPALVLSGFHPVRALRGGGVTGKGSVRLRQGLVVAQFAAAVFLLAGSAVVRQQTAFLDAAPLGFTREHVLALHSVPRDWSAEGVARLQPVKARLAAVPGVRAVSLSWETAADGGVNTFPLRRPEQPAEAALDVARFVVDEDFARVYGLRLVDGRFFEPDEASGGVLLNERAAAALGVEAPGQALLLGDTTRVPVLGVVRDFHFTSLHDPIRPLVLAPLAEVPLYRTLSLRLAPGDVAATLRRVEAVWREALPAAPFEYTFVDDDVAAQYAAEQRTGAVVGLAAGLAVLVAVLGMLGLVSLSVLQRRKEIGVRKVLGASVPRIVALFARDFGGLVVAGAAVAVPLTYLLAERWLEAFAYRIVLGPGPFLLASGLALGLALLLVGVQAARAASADPVQALRSE